MSYSATVLADSPSGAWLLDEVSGTVAADYSGNSRDLTNTNATVGSALASGVRAYDFNGTNAQLEIVDAAWQRPADFTVEAWMNLDALASFEAIAGKDGAGVGWAFYVDNATTKLNAFAPGAGGSHEGSHNVSASTDYHVVMTYDNATASLKTYINSVLDVSVPALGANIVGTSTSSLFFGVSTGSNGGASRFFWLDGRLARLAFYDHVLSSTRVSAHYAAGTAVDPDATVTPPAATATATAVAPVVSASRVVLPPAATATATALAPRVDNGLGNATISPPAATATATALAPTITQVISAGTDTSNSLNGRRRRARASVVVVRPAAATPSRAAVKYDKSVPYPPPTLVNGRPT